MILFIITDKMEQIVKIFVHQSYFIENDLVVDYNVEQGVILINLRFYYTFVINYTHIVNIVIRPI